MQVESSNHPDGLVHSANHLACHTNTLARLAESDPRQAESDWRQVAPSELTGEKRFIRLRWLKSVRDETFEKDAALVVQSLSSIEHFEYDGGGALVSVVRQRRENGFAREDAVIHGR